MNAHSIIIMQATTKKTFLLLLPLLLLQRIIWNAFVFQPIARTVYVLYESRKTFTLFYAYVSVCIVVRHLTFPDRVLLLIAIDHILLIFATEIGYVYMTQIKPTHHIDIQCIYMRSLPCTHKHTLFSLSLSLWSSLATH